MYYLRVCAYVFYKPIRFAFLWVTFVRVSVERKNQVIGRLVAGAGYKSTHNAYSLHTTYVNLDIVIN